MNTPNSNGNQNINTNPNIMGNQMPEISNVYPEIFYRLQPYIIMMCDQLDAYYGNTMPGPDMMDQITENMYKDIQEMYPDIAEYAREQENKEKTEPAISEVIARNPRIYRRGFRRRGLLRDLVDILFLSEFSRRRRRFY